MTHQPSLPKPKYKEATPAQFIWIGSLSLQIGAMMHFLVWQLTEISFGLSVMSFLGVYISSATFLLVGLVQNRIKNNKETPSKPDWALMEFDSEWEEEEGLRMDSSRAYQK